MPAVSRLVSPSESVHLVTREHGVVLVRPFLRSSLAIVLFGGGALEVAGSPAPAPVQWAAALLALFVVTISMTGLIRRVARWHSRRLIVTDERAILVTGMLGRRVLSIGLHGIRDLSIDMSGFGRVLRYGTVEVNVNGRRGPLFGLRRLRDPDLVTALMLGLAVPGPARRARRERVADQVEAAVSRR
jgi:PH (Pleckstrin Homology) domain-containing protein